MKGVKPSEGQLVKVGKNGYIDSFNVFSNPGIT